MCSIVGAINNTKNTIVEMNSQLKHRGPNIEGYYKDDYFHLGFRSLFKDRNKEELFNKEKTLTVVLDGKINNYKDLKEELEYKGYKFKTNKEAEVLLHGFDAYKEKLFSKLEGFFSFALYNIKEKEIIIVRDKIGIKPIYYYSKDNNFMFASEIKAFLKHPNFIKRLNYNQLNTYLSFQHSTTEETFFENVFKIRPGHYLKFKDSKVTITKYYEFKFNEKDKPIDYFEKKLEEKLNSSIIKLNNSKIGSFLSSGVDSSYIAVVSKAKKTFTVGFKNGIYDEISFASGFAKKMKLKNKFEYIDRKIYFEKFPFLQYHMDEPLADPAAPALYFASKLASEDVKIILSGEGADEFLGGYLIYKEPYSSRTYMKIPFFIRSFIAKIASLFPEKRGINFLIRKGTKLEDRYIGNANIFNIKEIKKITNQKKLTSSYKSVTKKLFAKTYNYDPCQKMQYIDINTWLVDDILLKADKMNMANSIECRMPFLDEKVIELASEIPTKFKLENNDTKYVFRKVAQKNLKNEVSQKEKLGFPVPICKWLKNESIYKMVRETFINNNLLNQKYILKLLDNHYYKNVDNSRKIWTIYSFLIWYNVYFNEKA